MPQGGRSSLSRDAFGPPVQYPHVNIHRENAGQGGNTNIKRSPTLTGSLTIAKPDWETYCIKLADMIVAEQSPAQVMEVRAKFYELLVHCIPPTVILKVSD